MILSPDHKILWDVTKEMVPRLKKIFPVRQLPLMEKSSETIGILTHRWSDNYFHWLIDVLPRLYLLRRSGLEMDRIIVNPKGSYPFQYETLKLLGIPKNKLIETRGSLHLQADRLVVPSPVRNKSTYSIPSWAHVFLREEMFNSCKKTKKQPGYERIYISRSHARFRKVLNESSVVDLLNKHGFKAINLESLSVEKQMQIFSSAEVVISPHGAGLTNLVFCDAKTKVIEFFSPTYVEKCYWEISSHGLLDYYYLIGKENIPKRNKDPRKDDIIVDTDALKRLLELASIKAK